jgi:hypothetical protein
MSVSINIPLSDTLQTVERPVIFDVIRKVQEITQISSKTPIRFYGEDARAAQFNSTITKDLLTDNLWPHTENLTIEIEEDHDPDRMVSTAVKTAENALIFYDKELDIGIKPVYSSSIIRIHFTYKAVDKNDATRWRNEIRTRYSMMRDINLHDISYSYHLPEVYIAILKELYRLRQNVAGYDTDTFESWFTKHMTNRASIVTNMSGNHGIWAIAETQCRVQGQFEFEGVPEKPTRDDEPNLWVTNFTYIFRYDKPINSVMVYPHVIHQQVLSTKYREDTAAYSYQALWKTYATSQENFAKFESDTKDRLYLSNRGLNIPAFDNFSPNSVMASTVRVATVLSIISEQDKRTLFNLNDLGDFNLKQEVLDFIKNSEYQYMTRPYGSILQLSVYEDQRIKDQSLIAIDSDLTVHATTDLDLRKTYRVRLSLVTNLSYLNTDALIRLKKNPVVAAILFNAINASINTMGGVKDIGYNKLPENQLKGLGLAYDDKYKMVVSNTDGLQHNLRGNDTLVWGLVETLFVTAYPMNQYQS